jgi:DNA-binding transcriptional ArsR family regulator
MTTLSEHLSRLSKRGGRARAKRMTAEERSQSARIAAEARWAKLKALADEITEGTKALEDKVRKREAHRAKKKTAV